MQRHDNDYHAACLQALCRICGHRVLTKKQKLEKRKPVKCTDISSGILMIFGINSQEDKDFLHPKLVCRSCTDRIRHCANNPDNEKMLLTARTLAASSQKLWVNFNENLSPIECPVCNCFHKTTLGSKGILKDKSHTVNLSSSVDSLMPENQLFQVATTDTLDDAHATYMTDCLSANFTLNTEPQSSFQTEQPFASSTPRRLPKAQTCTTGTSPAFKSDRLFAQSLEISPTRPIMTEEKELSTHFINRQLYNSKDGFFECESKNKTILLAKIPKAEVDSSKAKASTLRKRSKLLKKVFTSVSGKNTEAEIVQQVKVLNNNSIKKAVLKKAGLSGTNIMDNKSVLAMKEAASLTWSQLRIIRKFTKTAGLHLTHENKQRELVRTITDDDIVSKVMTFQNSDGEAISVPVVALRSIPDFVTKLLGKYKDHGKLTWHQSTIPKDEIWIKFGGDHGKGSMKFCMQVANLDKPNSKNNTFTVAMAKVKDSHHNLQVLMKMMNEQLEEVNQLEWEGKKIILFLFGDYEFLSKLYGLSGAASTYPCLWCLITRYEISKEHTEALSRTLGTIRRDNTRFLRYGKENKKQVARYHNCLHAPMVNIDVDRVAPPYLHILLGVVLKHHRLLEDDAHCIDVMLSEQAEGDIKKDGISLAKYGNNWKAANEIKQKIELLEAKVASIETDEAKDLYRRKLTETENALNKLIRLDLSPRSGPICRELDKILDDNNITPQSYHSRSFVGNHCHRYLTDKVYAALTSAVIKTTMKYTGRQDILDRAFKLQEKFNLLNETLRDIHTRISHSKPVNQRSLVDIQETINKYMKIYRRFFPTRVIPKQHLLEKHCVQWITQYGFGLGFHGEQGGELIHSTVAKLESRGRGIANKETHLRLTMTSQHLQIAPELAECAPPVKKRKTK